MQLEHAEGSKSTGVINISKLKTPLSAPIATMMMTLDHVQLICSFLKGIAIAGLCTGDVEIPR